MPCWRHTPSEWAPFDTALETALDATSGAAPDTAPGAAPKAAPKAVVKPLAAAPEASRCCCACTRRRSCNACNADHSPAGGGGVRSAGALIMALNALVSAAIVVAVVVRAAHWPL
jgi:hypothetical protein